MNSGLPPLEDILTCLRDLQLPVTTTTAPGLTGVELNALLRNFPLQLPEEVVHYYHWCNGTLTGSFIVLLGVCANWGGPVFG